MTLAAAPAPAPDAVGVAPPRLSVRGVRKAFRRRGAPPVLAVDGVSFDVPAGSVTALIGPSGCGKSTILRMAAGLEFPDEGRLLVDGREIEGPGRDRGMVFQSYTSFPWLTVRGNVEYGLRLAGVPRAERRETVERTIALVHLERFADAYPGELSGGMRQRVAIARAIATGPDLLLLDEPFGALDAQTRASMHALLLEVVRRTRLTALLVTHDVEEALTLAARIVVLDPHPGRVREIVEPDLPETGPDDCLALIASPAFVRHRLDLLGLIHD